MMMATQRRDDEPPNYVELHFGNLHQLSNDSNLGQQIPVISSPHRLSRYEQQKQRIDKYFAQSTVDQHSTSAPSVMLRSGNNPDPVTKLKMPDTTIQTRQHKDPRDFATFLCKFLLSYSVLNMKN